MDSHLFFDFQVMASKLDHFFIDLVIYSQFNQLFINLVIASQFNQLFINLVIASKFNQLYLIFQVMPSNFSQNFFNYQVTLKHLLNPLVNQNSSYVDHCRVIQTF
jgi:hypothetical protein